MDVNQEINYQALLQHLPLPVALLHVNDGVIRYVNQQPLPERPLQINTSIFDWLQSGCEDCLGDFQQHLQAIASGNETEYTLEVHCFNDELPTRWYQLHLRKVDAENALVSFHDISAQKRLQADNQLLQDQLHVVFDEALDVIVLVDENERILRINPVVELLLGYKPEELVGKSFSSMLQLSQEEDNSFFNSLADYGAVFTAVPFLRMDGETCYMELTATLVPWQDTHAVMITLRDVTHKEELQREVTRIRHAQEKHEHEKALVNARANMIFVIAHQFRTPLTTISASAQILNRYHDRMEPAKYAEHLERIEANATQINDMIIDMLEAREAFHHGVEFQPTQMHLGEHCATIFNEISEQHPNTHRFRFEDSSSPDYAMLDPVLVKYIVDNLLTNAVKYSPTGGLVEMKLREEEDAYILSVSDEGIGIPEESRDQIFELFIRGNNVKGIQGTGIGLGLVRICVEQHKGSIDFVSKMGVGSLFTVRLPIVRPNHNPPKRSE
ncbi:MAG: PAS domain S-box protein [Anaerolineae bacterium]|nr:PAS domain S-box protein [Anaerolineae bacterium]